MKEESHSTGRRRDGEPAPDAWLREALAALDPGTTDPGYWTRFHRAVMAAARDELARRRMLADVTVSELVTSWARTLVPTALLAAAAAAFLLLRPAPPTASPEAPEAVALEELFESGGDRTLFAAPEPDAGMDVTFASEVF